MADANNNNNKKKEEKKNTQKPQQEKGGKKGEKKATGLGIEAKKEDDFPTWYSQVITQSEMIEYYDVSGCYILRPQSYFMWEQIKDFFDREIKLLGVENAYFPLFVSKAALNKEENHIAGFAPEVAWVTKSGQSDLAEPIAVRPTSETIMYPAYAKWIRSHRDLPLKLNQWCNVVRWEFKNPTPFLRSREFLWQEGHTVFAKKEQADAEVLDILELYRRVFEEILCVPVIKGRKSENEKFAGGLYTTSVEAFIPASGRGIQGATSHCLGQNFSKMFDIQFENEKEEKVYAWQNSWGLTTRTIGVMVMVHADNKGLVLPPKISPTQIVIIPILLANQDEGEKKIQLEKCEEFRSALKAKGYRVHLDDRLGYSPGWKYNHWELKGVPLRVEVGPKDVKEQTAVIARRDNGEKSKVAWSEVVSKVEELIVQIPLDLLAKARKERDEHLVKCDDWDTFMSALDSKKICVAPWCDTIACEEAVKDKSAKATKEKAVASSEGHIQIATGGAKTLNIPFEQDPVAPGTKCFACDKEAKLRALWGRSF